MFARFPSAFEKSRRDNTTAAKILPVQTLARVRPGSFCCSLTQDRERIRLDHSAAEGHRTPMLDAKKDLQ